MVEEKKDTSDLIFPPPDMRGIIEKLADHVAKHGVDFEKRALRENNEKLAFLRENNPYRPYYEYRLAEIKANHDNSLANGISGVAPSKPVALQEIEREEEEKKRKKEAKKLKGGKAANVLPLALADFAANPSYDTSADQATANGAAAAPGAAGLDPSQLQLAKTATNTSHVAVSSSKVPFYANVQEPAADEYTVPYFKMAPLDMDIIKVTAQFVARNGGSFLEDLANREGGNPQFEFLKPTNHLFSYFTGMCDAYTKVLTNPTTNQNGEHLIELRRLATDRNYVIEKAVERFKWDEKTKREKETKEVLHQKERAVMEAIDWHDFVVAETITFTEEDDIIPLQAPIDFRKLELRAAKALDPEMNLPQVIAEEERMDLSDEELDADALGEDVLPVVDFESTVASGKLQLKQPPPVPEKKVVEKPKEPEVLDPQTKLPKVPIPKAKGQALTGANVSRAKEVLDEEIVVPDNVVDFENVVVRTDYVRKRERNENKAMQVCPLTGQMVAADDMADHMRILLMDPKYKTQRDKALEKAKSENYYINDVDSNLGAFAAMRPDLFGTIEEEIAVAADEDEEAMARAAGADAGPAHTVYNPDALRGGVRRGPTGVAVPTNEAPDSGEESDGEPPLKRQKTIQNTLILETEFILRNSDAPAVLLIQVSKDLQSKIIQSSDGQISIPSELEVTLKVTTKIGALKQSLCGSLGCEPDSVKFINAENDMVLRANRTLAYYNVGKGGRLRLEARSNFLIPPKTAPPVVNMALIPSGQMMG
ncbi:unnamed protein product [Amoebophrya sp. A120]|nr:unnamed protein product [Amoebophrya sp. A120]|eukprot:GSA120T00009218001.1